ncbi:MULTISPECIES: hypothetical protein [Bacillus]|uniref:hypothetical protein n=1 Tax=Bacillus TaxID=1386 RepID=UPI001583793B|nr:hypothetical protein [Bacillus glycinifermentans]MBU8789025.1 hypothetical protein [Bacillus glycinifermentans]NUJ18031.1 hypothetical protein [Bacillus glycinifermentans]
MKTIPVIAFKAKDKEKRYLCDGPDCGDWSDENLDVSDIEDALCLVRKDKQRPTDDDIDHFFDVIHLLSSEGFSYGPSVDDIKENYDPVHVNLTEAQYNVMKERNDWG